MGIRTWSENSGEEVRGRPEDNAAETPASLASRRETDTGLALRYANSAKGEIALLIPYNQLHPSHLCRGGLCSQERFVN